jgi:hypothetical protein
MRRPRPNPRRAAHPAAILLCLAASVVPAALTGPAAHAVTDSEVITVDTGQQLGPLSEAGLGTLFGVAGRVRRVPHRHLAGRRRGFVPHEVRGRERGVARRHGALRR